jgi:hypothetical protein
MAAMKPLRLSHEHFEGANMTNRSKQLTKLESSELRSVQHVEEITAVRLSAE